MVGQRLRELGVALDRRGGRVAADVLEICHRAI
jgi:hypothetical protein